MRKKKKKEHWHSQNTHTNSTAAVKKDRLELELLGRLGNEAFEDTAAPIIAVIVAM
jgi:hypothetical protein